MPNGFEGISLIAMQHFAYPKLAFNRVGNRARGGNIFSRNSIGTGMSLIGKPNGGGFVEGTSVRGSFETGKFFTPSNWILD